jgi:hypothetical protein
MKIDLYTKIILTVIAGCLVYLCCINRIEPAQAQSTTRVIIAGVDMQDHLLPVGISSTGIKCEPAIPGVPRSCKWDRVPIPVQTVPDKP